MNSMKKFKLPFLFLMLFSSFLIEAQVLGLGYNTNFNSNQFVASVNLPFRYSDFSKKNFILEYGIDFTTRNTNSFSGIYLKPIQLNYNFNKSGTDYDKPFIEISAEGSFLINNGLGNNGFVVSSNFYIDNGNFFYLKSGFEHHIDDKTNQFYIRLGVTFSKNMNFKVM